MKKRKDYSDLINKAISWGASVVIIGVLFKILHIGGSLANLMIGVGLGVEAILFFLMGFNPPPKEHEWEKVYPELADDYEGDPVVPARRNVETPPSATAALDKMFADAQINQSSIQSLGNGLRAFN